MSDQDQRYICSRCGYVYVPDQGDPLHAIPAGVAFGALPENWTCPLCYAGKEEFDPLD